jgi:putative ABC transport system permease protein
MSFALLTLRSAFRNPLRTSLTALGAAIAIVAFLFLRTFIAAYYVGLEAAAEDRLVVRNKISITFPLPLAYKEKLKGVTGVREVSWGSWFGGYYKDPKDFFAQVALDAKTAFEVYPEFLLSPAEKQAFEEDRAGAVVGDLLADKYGWKVGDRVTLNGTIYPGTWDFTIRGIYRGRDKATDRQQFLFHWALLNEKSEAAQKDQVSWFILRVDPGTPVAPTVDAMFKNSLAETRTETEKQFQLSFLSMTETVVLAIRIISYVVLVILILILGNTLAMATRERTREYAAMRAIGFTPGHITRLVLGEGFVVGGLGAALGLLLAPPILTFFADIFQRQLGSFLGAFELSPVAAAAAVGVSMGGGMLAAALPAVQASRLRIAEALRRID